ncbi:MAG: hypothetical protein IPM01_30980 [Burkholderiaceae bacterium]|nr:hypothetical protein [Burkholderiaceae bacterium]
MQAFATSIGIGLPIGPSNANQSDRAGLRHFRPGRPALPPVRSCWRRPPTAAGSSPPACGIAAVGDDRGPCPIRSIPAIRTTSVVALMVRYAVGLQFNSAYATLAVMLATATNGVVYFKTSCTAFLRA